MRQINVCQIVNNLDYGGLEKIVIDLVNGLDSDNMRQHLVCLRGKGALFKDAHLPESRVLILDLNPSLNLGVGKVDPGIIGPIRRFLSERHIDVVHTHNLAPMLMGGIGARLLRRRPKVVYSEHNQIQRANKWQAMKFRGYSLVTDEIVAVSHDLKKTLTDDVKVKRPVRVLHNGIDGTRFSRVNGDRVRKEFGIGADEFLIGTVVRLTEQKGVRYLIEAAPKVLQEAPNTRFLIAGDGPDRADLEKQAAELNLGDRVIFPGYRDDVPDLISAFDTYVLPSLWEGLPLALCETLAIGTPVVCTTVGGNPEVVVDGENGFLVPPKAPDALAEKLLAMRADPDKRAAMGKANRERFDSQFSLQRMLERHADLYRSVARA